MQQHMNDRLNTPDRPFRKKSRTMFLPFLLPRLGLVLLVAVATIAIATQSAHGGEKPQEKGASGTATVTLVKKVATIVNFKLTGGPPNVPLIIHIHGDKGDKSCKGPVLYKIDEKDIQTEDVIKTDGGDKDKDKDKDKDEDAAGGAKSLKTDAKGNFSIKAQKFTVYTPPPGAAPAPPADLTKINLWYFNVHNMLKPLPPDPANPKVQKYESVACGLLKVAEDPTTATAKLKPESAAGPKPPDAPPPADAPPPGDAPPSGNNGNIPPGNTFTCTLDVVNYSVSCTVK